MGKMLSAFISASGMMSFKGYMSPGSVAVAEKGGTRREELAKSFASSTHEAKHVRINQTFRCTYLLSVVLQLLCQYRPLHAASRLA